LKLIRAKPATKKIFGTIWKNPRVPIIIKYASDACELNALDRTSLTREEASGLGTEWAVGNNGGISVMGYWELN
jgi:hypothetical protein